MLAVPVNGGAPTCLARSDVNDFQWKWSPDGRTLVVSGPTPGAMIGRSYIVPLPRDRMFPDLPARGFTREAELAGLPGVRQVPALDVSFGSDGNYAYSRVSVLRNLYRIPLP